MVVLFCAVAAVAAGCAQTEGLVNTFQENSFAKPADFFKVPSWGQLNKAGNNVNLTPKGPVPADQLISATGYCAPAAEPAAAQPAPAVTPQPAQTAAATQGSAPPPDRLQPAGLGPSPAMQAPVMGGVMLGMSECAVARRLGSPSNVSISAGPKGQRRVVLTYLEGERPGLYSFQSGRLIQVDATPQQAAKYDKQVKKGKKASRRAPARQTDRMYVQ